MCASSRPAASVGSGMVGDGVGVGLTVALGAEVWLDDGGVVGG